jgi:hypothetical protein
MEEDQTHVTEGFTLAPCLDMTLRLGIGSQEQMKHIDVQVFKTCRITVHIANMIVMLMIIHFALGKSKRNY